MVDINEFNKPSKPSKKQEDEEEEMDIEVEFTTRQEYFESCHTLLTIMDFMNPMTQEETNIKANIKRRCFKILDVMSAEMYDELFEDREEIDG